MTQVMLSMVTGCGKPHYPNTNKTHIKRKESGFIVEYICKSQSTHAACQQFIFKDIFIDKPIPFLDNQFHNSKPNAPVRREPWRCIIAQIVLTPLYTHDIIPYQC